MDTIHFQVERENEFDCAACDKRIGVFGYMTSRPEKVTCRKCLRTKAWREARTQLVAQLQRMDSMVELSAVRVSA